MCILGNTLTTYEIYLLLQFAPVKSVATVQSLISQYLLEKGVNLAPPSLRRHVSARRIRLGLSTP